LRCGETQQTSIDSGKISANACKASSLQATPSRSYTVLLIHPSLVFFHVIVVAHVDETKGSDETGNGSVEAPYLSAVKALQAHGDAVKIQVWKTAAPDSNETSGYAPISGAALKKAIKKVGELEKKAKKVAEQAAELAAKEQAATEERERVLEAAKLVVLKEDLSLPTATKIKIRGGVENRGKRVKISGWVHRLRVQGKNMTFVILRDGTGYLQCVLTDALVRINQ